MVFHIEKEASKILSNKYVPTRVVRKFAKAAIRDFALARHANVHTLKRNTRQWWCISKNCYVLQTAHGKVYLYNSTPRCRRMQIGARSRCPSPPQQWWTCASGKTQVEQQSRVEKVVEGTFENILLLLLASSLRAASLFRPTCLFIPDIYYP